MTVDEALARLDGSDGQPGGAEATADGLGDIADLLATEVRRLRATLREIAGIASTQPGTLAVKAMTTDDKLARAEQHLRMILGLSDRALGAPPPPMPGSGPQFGG